MRLMPDWSAASVNVSQDRVTASPGAVPGSKRDEPSGKVRLAPNVSERANMRRISAPAAEKVE